MNPITAMMERAQLIAILLLLMATAAVRAQTDDWRRLRADSLKSDYEEWLRNEPMKPSLRDSQALAPLPPSIPLPSPQQLKPDHPKISINIMTPTLRTDMQLAYQSHWLEQQRKEQQGGAMMIGVNPLSLVGIVLHKLFPHRKSKKQRQREKLQQILDNY